MAVIQARCTVSSSVCEAARALVERMDAFGDAAPGEREPVNIHDVLDQAKRAARAGFARHVRIREEYDPSLPPVPADRGQLLQAISNLVKNAAEAVPRQGGEIVMKTAFRPGVQIALAGGARERLRRRDRARHAVRANSRLSRFFRTPQRDA